MRTAHAIIAGLVAFAAVSVGAIFTVGSTFTSGSESLAISGTALSCVYVPGTPPAFSLDCEAALSPSATVAGISPTATSTPTSTYTMAPSSTSQPSPTKSPTPSTTSTPIATATRTAIPTATNTPASSTPTPTTSSTGVPTSTATLPASSANTLQAVINDMTAPHDGPLCGVSGYDWELRAANQGGQTNFPTGTAWGATQWKCGVAPTPNTVLETRNFRGYVLAAGQWYLITNSIQWCGVLSSNYGAFASPSTGPGNIGPNWTIPTAFVGSLPPSLHWASFHTPMPAGVVCAFSTYEARITGAGAATAFLMADAGLDYWNGNSIDPSHVGRVKRVTPAWGWINGSSCTEAQLRAAPPPGVTP